MKKISPRQIYILFITLTKTYFNRLDKRISKAHDDARVREILLNFEYLERMFTKAASSMGTRLNTEKTFGKYRSEYMLDNPYTEGYSKAFGPKLSKLCNLFSSHVKVGVEIKIDED